MNVACVRCGKIITGGSCPECGAHLTFVERELQRFRVEARSSAPNPRSAAATATLADEGSIPPPPLDTDRNVPAAESRSTPSEGTVEGVVDDRDDDTSRRAERESPDRPTPGASGTGGREARAGGGNTSSREFGGPTLAGLRARELDVNTPEGARAALAEVLEHRRRGRGRIIGIAGPPRHGKTKLADRIREKAVERPGVDLRYDKTSRGRVNIYYVPGRREHHVLIDVAGEDFQLLGDYSRELPALMSEFMWPVLQRMDGLLLLLALPIVWSGWNRPDLDQREEPDQSVRDEMRWATAAMVDAHRTLLKYALVARSLRRTPRLARRFGVQPHRAPSRRQVDDVYQAARPLPYPVLLGFSKADLYASVEGRSGLYAPSPPGFDRAGPALHPLRTDPLALARVHFPELFDFLMARVRHFKFDFVQALEDDSERPDPQEARVPDAPIESLLGGEGALGFLTGHPWRLPGISTRTALRIDRWIRRGRWESTALEALAGTDPREAL